MNTLKHRSTAKATKADNSFELESAAEQGKVLELETGGRKKEQKSGSSGLTVGVVMYMLVMLFYVFEMNGFTSVVRNQVSSMINVNGQINESSHLTQLQQQWKQWHNKEEEDDDDDDDNDDDDDDDDDEERGRDNNLEKQEEKTEKENDDGEEEGTKVENKEETKVEEKNKGDEEKKEEVTNNDDDDEDDDDDDENDE